MPADQTIVFSSIVPYAKYYARQTFHVWRRLFDPRFPGGFIRIDQCSFARKLGRVCCWRGLKVGDESLRFIKRIAILIVEESRIKAYVCGYEDICECGFRC